MAAPNVSVDPSQTTEYITSQPLMKIQGTNFQVKLDVSLYPKGLKMRIVSLTNFVLSTAVSSSFSVPLSWLSLAGSTTVHIMAVKIITFQMMNDKKFMFTKKLFA